MMRLIKTLPRVIRDNVIVWGALWAFFLWHYQMPVAVFMQAHDWSVTPGSVRAVVSGIKVRSCEFIKGSEAGYAKFWGGWQETRFMFGDDPSPGSTRPKGVQSFGVWVWFHPESELPSQVKITVKHICSGTTIVSEQGPFDVPKGLSP